MQTAWLDYNLNNILSVFNLLNWTQVSEQILVSYHIILCLQFLEDEAVILSFMSSVGSHTDRLQTRNWYSSEYLLVGSAFQHLGL